MSDNPYQDLPRRSPLIWVIESRRNRSEAFHRTQVIPTQLKDRTEREIDQLNVSAGFKKYRLVSR